MQAEDVSDLLNVSDMRAFQNLIELLPEKVGSQLSINSLREDVEKAYATIRVWYQVLETLYYSFTIKPYSKKITRALRAEPKMFLFDILRIPKDHKSKRLENLNEAKIYADFLSAITAAFARACQSLPFLAVVIASDFFPVKY